MEKTLSVLAAAALSVAVLSAPSAQPSAAAGPLPVAATPTTQLTLEVKGCDGCTVGVASYLYMPDRDPVIWDEAKPKKVVDGAVTFAVPTDRTPGLSITVRAPWEGATGYVTNVALRYRGRQPGDKVGFTAARASDRASACWSGTTEDAATITVKVREVRVQGYGGRVAGSIAWAAVTQDWRRPLVDARHGVVGTQDLMPCKG